MTARYTAGTYLRRRRLTAGLSIGDTARLASDTRFGALTMRILIRRCEADRSIAMPWLLTRLAKAFRFDGLIYFQLYMGIGKPRICTACGCTALNACDTEEAGRCAWSQHVPDLCTHCATYAAAAFDPAPSRALALIA